MKAVVYESYGDAFEVCRVVKGFPQPSLEAGVVLVKQEAFSFNPIDYKFIQGLLGLVETTKSWPIVPGFDVCGTVLEVNAGSRFKVGQRVIGYQSLRRGCAAEVVAIAEAHCVLCPEDLTIAEAAGVPLVGVTSWQSLRVGNLQEGDGILVLGGTTATGLMGVQIARAVGAKVYATCSPRNAELVRMMGAEVCDYHEENWWEKWKDEGIRLIYDCVGGTESWVHAQSFLQGGHFITIAGDRQDKLGASTLVDAGARIAWRKAASWFTSAPRYTFHTAYPDGESLQAVVDLIKSGRLRPVVDSSYPFTSKGVSDAFRKLMGGRCVGKVIVLAQDE